jgi:DNA-binding LytR/AlgR family response regulator
MMTYAIVDDEPIAHKIIEDYAKELPYLEKVENCYNAFEALASLQKQTVDILFLDINMPKLTGFEMLKTLSYQPKVIVTSAHSKFALEGYEFDVTDYLLKPFAFERFLKAVNKVRFQQKEEVASRKEQQTHINIKSDKLQYRVAFDDIRYIEASRNYCKVFTVDKVLKTLVKISDFEKKLPTHFIRVHNSFIINQQKIEAIEGNTIHIQAHRIPVGQTYRNEVKRLFEEN